MNLNKPSLRPITIVGGGLAGLALGIGLRRRAVPVALWEAGNYPRHRVCGEFISGRGQDALKRLGVHEPLSKAGAIHVKTAVFAIGGTMSPVRDLPSTAIGLSRLKLDALLANVFRDLGGELRVNERCREQSISDGTVIASGRRPHPVESGWRWFGLKIHARGLPLAADLEMHCVPNGYVGVNRIDNGEFNVCGLFRKPAQAAGEKTEPRDLLRGPKQTLLRQRLEAAHFDEASFCSVAGLSLHPYRAAGSDECCIGDALTMTPPVTGNGMSMAFESAEIATEPLAAYSAGQMSWPEAQRIIATRCDEAFGTRLAWASRLQWMMFSPLFRGWLGLLALRSDWLWRLFFAKTR